MPPQGPLTAQIAATLGEWNEEAGGRRFRIYCHHPADRRAELEELGVVVCRPTLCYDRPSRDTNLAYGDILISRRQTEGREEALIWLEVEEASDGTAPKTIVADAMITLVADHIWVGPKKGDELPAGLRPPRSLASAEIWIAYVSKSAGDETRREVLRERLTSLVSGRREQVRLIGVDRQDDLVDATCAAVIEFLDLGSGSR